METAHATYQPDINRLSQVTFWDTTLSRIDWRKHADYVIERVFGYGTDDERRCIADFYGKERLAEFRRKFRENAFNSHVKENLNSYISDASL
ncbi:MAG: hypothetical protein J6I49_07005 [Bacteroidales bacterium]|nr:hypothetical protein [Bacteroidales bacterium]